MFALISLSDPTRVNLKCEPEYAIELREQYSEAIIGGWHMSKKHWNTIDVSSGELSATLVKELIDHSYDLVVKNLPKHKKPK